MVRSVTATQAKATLLTLLDEVEAGEEIEITRRGRLVARLTPTRGGAALRGRYAGLAWTNVEDDELLIATDMEWSYDEDNLP